MFCRSWCIGYQSKVPFISQDLNVINYGGVQHDEGEGYQQPITFRRVSESQEWPSVLTGA